MEANSLRRGERRNVTVLFSDMKGFTALSEKLDPEEIDSLMTQVFAAFEAIIRKHGGIVEKYIGDALVAVFGAGRIHEDDPARAVHAALDFLDHLKTTSHRIAERGGEISFRTGIHTGLIATGKRGDYEVVSGHAMSVASRLQSSAKPQSILVSESTMEKCDADFVFIPAGTITVKGRKEPIRVFEVGGRNTDPLRYPTPFAGREQQLKIILRAYLKADGSIPSGFFVVGEPGIGKTRLVAQFIAKLKSFPDFSAPVMYARARRFRSLRFSIANDLLFSFLRIDQYSQAKTIEHALAKKLDVEIDVARRFASLASDEVDAPTETSSFMLHIAILEKILRRSAETPYSVILFIDNVQDLDGESRDFLRFFTQNTKVHPFLILAGRTVAPELVGMFPHFDIVHLKALHPEEAAELVEADWPEGTASSKKTIIDTAEGNPLFIEEYVKFAREGRDLSGMPMTIQNLLLSSIDRYGPEEREVLKTLSVFLHSFTLMDARFIQDKTGGPIDDVETILDSMTRDGVIVHENNLYFFKHELVKQALYNSLLNYNKKILHRLVADLLFRQKTPNMLRLVHHLAKSEDWGTLEKTISEDPARLQRMEYLGFIDLLEQRGEKTDISRHFRFLFSKAAILFNNGKNEGAEAILQEIMRIAVMYRRHEFSANAYHLMCAHYTKECSFSKALFCGQRAIHHYRLCDPAAARIQSVSNDMAMSALFSGDYERNERIIADMPARANDRSADLKALSLAQRLFYLGDYREAIDAMKQGMPPAKDTSDETWIVGTSLIAHVHRRMRNYEALVPCVEDLLAVYSHDYLALADLYAFRAEAAYALRHAADVTADLKQAEYYATQGQTAYDEVRAQRTLAEVLRTTGNAEEAERFARRGLELGLRHSIFEPAFAMLLLLVEIYLERGRRADAEYMLEEARPFAESGVHLLRCDRAVYHYFCGTMRAEGDAAAIAARLMRDELSALGDRTFQERLLAGEPFASIAASIRPSGAKDPPDPRSAENARA